MFDDILDMLGGEDFEERPVTIEEFVTSKEYLGLPPLSEHQYTAIRAMSQIYKKETLIHLYGEEAGLKRWKQTMNEVILQLGKGSGKDYMSTIAVAYIVYLLLCLKDPAKYFGKPPGDSIDIINIAINADQAKRVFFDNFKKRIDNCPWFAGKYNPKQNVIEFDKYVNCYSGHSEREAFEGYNVICVILDEISGFAIDSTSGHDQAKTAGAIYDMYRASVDSRFPDFGKLILLSFPRYKNDYIQQRYNAVVADKDVVVREHEFVIDEDGDVFDEMNRFSIHWEEDHITSYKVPKVFALRRPTWEVNPTRKITDFKIQFLTNPTDALSRFACMPPDAVDAFFPSREKIDICFNQNQFAVDDKGQFAEWFTPDEDKVYFVHVDLAQKHDHCAVSLAHVEKWVKTHTINDVDIVVPVVVVDAVRWWTPTADKAVNFTDVKNYVLELRNRGFKLKKVTFDRWNSFDIMNELRAYGINTETLSVAKKHYEDMKMLVSEERIIGPSIDLLKEELVQLRILRDKVDHPRKGSKDLSDAVCGSIYNAISGTPKNTGLREIEIHTYASLGRQDRLEQEENNVIYAPKRTMPDNMKDYLINIGMI
jgi:hypothetical protein